MGFIRLKKRNLNKNVVYYGYLVKNKWNKKLNSPRQAVSKYLGRVHIIEEKKEVEFSKFHNIKDLDSYIGLNSKSKIINDLIEWELYRHNAKELKIKLSKKKRTLLKDQKEVVIKLNQGFLCGYTIRRLFNFNDHKENDEREAGIKLAERFTDAGIKIPPEVFIGLFDKIVTIEY